MLVLQSSRIVALTPLAVSSISKSTNKQCSRNVIGKSKYCWQHTKLGCKKVAPNVSPVTRKDNFRSPDHLRLNEDELTNILLETKTENLSSICSVNRLATKICKDKNFWHQKFDHDFGKTYMKFEYGEKPIFSSLKDYINFCANLNISQMNEDDWTEYIFMYDFRGIPENKLKFLPKIIRNNKHFLKKRSLYENNYFGKYYGFKLKDSYDSNFYINMKLVYEETEFFYAMLYHFLPDIPADIVYS